jgi:hypothetical protein
MVLNHSYPGDCKEETQGEQEKCGGFSGGRQRLGLSYVRVKNERNRQEEESPNVFNLKKNFLVHKTKYLNATYYL